MANQEKNYKAQYNILILVVFVAFHWFIHSQKICTGIEWNSFFLPMKFELLVSSYCLIKMRNVPNSCVSKNLLLIDSQTVKAKPWNISSRGTEIQIQSVRISWHKYPLLITKATSKRWLVSVRVSISGTSLMVTIFQK